MQHRSDNFPIDKPEELDIQSRRVELHHQSLELPQEPLCDREEARQKYGINGDIKAIIMLPTTEPGNTKRLAIVDFGDIDSDSPTALFADHEGREYAHLGSADSRFGIVGLHEARDHMITYRALETGTTPIGRQRDAVSYALGLTDSDKGTSAISNVHAIIELDEQGSIIITDHSRNTTTVEVAAISVDPDATTDEDYHEYPEDALLRRLFPEKYGAKTRGLLESKAWQEMSPNFEDTRNLEPKDLSPELILAAINALKHITTETENDPVIVKGFGELWPTGSGESKTGFMFVRPDGKRMHVLVDPGYSLEPQVQDNPKVYLRQRGFHYSLGADMEYGTYSDARTYVSLVMESISGEAIGIHFQEYGGDTSDRAPNPVKRAAAVVRAKRYIAEHGYRLGDEREFNHPRHYLRRDGPLAVIDIAVARPYNKIKVG